jgi:hypothetical protein
VWFRSALADCLDQGFKPAPVLFDTPLFGGLPFRSPLLFAKPALVLTRQCSPLCLRLSRAIKVILLSGVYSSAFSTIGIE